MPDPAPLPSVVPIADAPRARPRPLMSPDVELAFCVLLHAADYGHQVCCGGQAGNVFAVALADAEILTGRLPGPPGPRPETEAARARALARLTGGAE